MTDPRLVGVIHLAPLPGSPRFSDSLSEVVAAAARDAAALQHAGFDAVIVENYGDAPFYPGAVEPETLACMTACALAVREAAPKLALGVNVLRSDALGALGIAAAAGASMVRVNVHAGARVTDQGVIEGQAHRVTRKRRSLGLDVALWCDAAVKHSAPLAPRPLAEEVAELCERGLADAVLLTGSGTGRPVAERDLDEALEAADSIPVYLASGITPESASLARRAHGVIVGSWLRADGRAGGPIDPDRARALARALGSSKTTTE